VEALTAAVVAVAVLQELLVLVALVVVVQEKLVVEAQPLMELPIPAVAAAVVEIAQLAQAVLAL
jgi:hypothetical protein